MKMCKYLVGTILALCLVTAVQAQYASLPVTLEGATIAASTATNGLTSSTIDCRRQNNVAFQLRFSTDAANTGAVTAYLVKSVDGVYLDDELYPVGAASVAAGTHVVQVTNIATAGFGWMKVLYVTNANQTANVTNLSLKYSVKRNAP
jgi:hypothetical protein